MKPRHFLALGCALGLGGCASAQQSVRPEPVERTQTSSQALTAATQPASPDPIAEWDCQGTLVPPAGWMIESAVVSTSGEANPDQKAADLARANLLQRVCGDVPCARIAARVTIWKQGHAPGKACAQAALDGAALREVEETVRGATVDTRLAQLVPELLAAFPAGEAARVTIVVIDKVVDENLPGGPRADWLARHMRAVIGKHQRVALQEPPRAWAGDGLPEGIDLLLEATLTEKARDTLEVSWQGRVRDGKRVRLLVPSPVEIPAAAAPKAAVMRAAPLSKTPGLSVRLQAGSGGSLCPGEVTTLLLHSDKDRYVQVWDLYGKGLGKAMLLFPASDSEGRVRAGETVTIGGAGFQAMPVEGAAEERFLVLGAPTKEAFGPLGKLVACRLDEARTRELLDPARLPRGLAITADGFRIADAENCRGIAAPSVAEIETAIEAVPMCP